MSPAILTIAFVLPLLWSAVVAGLRRLSPADGPPDDRTEKRFLLLLLAPVLLAPAAAITAHWLPLPAPPVALTATVLASTSGSAPVTSLWQPLAPWLVPAGLTVYAIGLAIRVVPLALQCLALDGIVRRARPSAVAPDVRLTEAAVPPLSWGRGVVLLPQSLIKHLSVTEIDLLIAHERAHIARGDIVFYAILSWIDAAFWFNPFVRHQTTRCRLAAELACDAAVTHAAPAMREAYAACLLTALKHTAGDALQCAPAVFSPTNSGEFKMRMTEIMRNSTAPRKPRPLLQVTAALLLLPLAGVQYAWSQGAAAETKSLNCLSSTCTLSGTEVRWDSDTLTQTAVGDAQIRANGRSYHADSVEQNGKTGEVKFTGAVTVSDISAADRATDARLAKTARVMAEHPERATSADMKTGRALSRGDDGPAVTTTVADNAVTVTGRPTQSTTSDNAVTVRGRPTQSTTSDNAIMVTGRPTQSTTSGNTVTVVGRPAQSTDNVITVTGRPSKPGAETITVTGRPLKPSDTTPATPQKPG